MVRDLLFFTMVKRLRLPTIVPETKMIAVPQVYTITPLKIYEQFPYLIIGGILVGILLISWR